MHYGLLGQVAAKCRSEVMQKAPVGAFFITFDLHYVVICLKAY